MSTDKGPCDGCDCNSSCPCVCRCTPCKCLCIKAEAVGKNDLDLQLNSIVALRRIKGLQLNLLAAVLDANSRTNILIPAQRAMERVALDEVCGRTLSDALEKLGLRHSDD